MILRYDYAGDKSILCCRLPEKWIKFNVAIFYLSNVTKAQR